MSKLKIGKHTLELSNLDKTIYPDEDVTKGDVIDYYRDVAKHFVPHARGRALTLHRYPDGIGKKGFIQQQHPGHAPGWVGTVTVRRSGSKGRKIKHTVCNDSATLAFLANLAALELHGWLSRAPRTSRPDRLIFDLDPPGKSFAPVIQAARRVRSLMKKVGLEPYVMTTGSRGLHVVAPLDGGEDFETVREFARDLAAYLADRHPDDLTVEQRKNKRRGRLYLDMMRNSRGQTAVLPYSLRAKAGAPVATPLAWKELGRKGLDARSYHIGNIKRRLSQRGDPWKDIERGRKGLKQARKALEKLSRKG